MAVFTKEICQKKLNTWLAAEEAIATGQSYQIGSRMLTRADLKQVREEMEYWAGKLAEAEAEVAEPFMELPLLVAPEALALFSYD